MNDLILAGSWGAVLAGGLAGAVIVRRLGLAATYTRDLLHVGAGVWVVGWPWWTGPALPIAITGATVLVVALVPLARRRSAAAASLHEAVTGGDERWGGLVLYSGSYMVYTAAGLVVDALPAAAALLALSLGDGIGGALGRRFGRIRFRAPGGKWKTLEGSITVGIMAAGGALAAAAIVSAPLGAGRAVLTGAVAAAAEAAAPRGTDNAVVPSCVWLALTIAA